MRVRKFVDQKKEIIFYAIGTLIMLAIVIYLFTLVQVLSQKVSKVFAPPIPASEQIVRYNFDAYEKMFPGFSPSSAALQGAGTSTPQ